MNTFAIALDVDKRDNDEVVVLRQGDVNGTTIVATITDHGLPMGAEEYDAAFCMTLPDRKSYYREEATYSNGVVVVTVDETRAAVVAGSTNNAYFELYQNDELKYTTASFVVRVKESAVNGKRASATYDTYVETLMASLNEAIESCVAPSVTVEEIEGGHEVTVVTPSGDSVFDVLDGEKGDQGEKGETGDATLPDSVSFAQLAPEVRNRIYTNRLLGVLTDEKPSASDAFPSELVGVTFYGLSTQSLTPSPSRRAPITSAESATLHLNDDSGDGWPMHVEIADVTLRSLRNGTRDELAVDSDGTIKLIQRVGVVDLGTLSWTRAETKTGGMARYTTNGLNGTIVAASSNGTAGSLMCEAYETASYTSTYNRVDGTIGVSTVGTIAVYDSGYAGNTHGPAEFAESISGVKLQYALVHPVVTEVGSATLPSVTSPSVSAYCDVPFLLSYERDIHVVVEELEAAISH